MNKTPILSHSLKKGLAIAVGLDPSITSPDVGIIFEKDHIVQATFTVSLTTEHLAKAIEFIDTVNTTSGASESFP